VRLKDSRRRETDIALGTVSRSRACEPMWISRPEILGRAICRCVRQQLLGSDLYIRNSIRLHTHSKEQRTINVELEDGYNCTNKERKGL